MTRRTGQRLYDAAEVVGLLAFLVLLVVSCVGRVTPASIAAGVSWCGQDRRERQGIPHVWGDECDQRGYSRCLEHGFRERCFSEWLEGGIYDERKEEGHGR